MFGNQGRDLSTSDKWHVLQLLLVFNTVIGFGFLLSSLFVDGIWGAGASLQVVLTSLIYFSYCGYLLMWVRRQEIVHVDFLGGVSVMMNVILLQTAALWGDIAGGMNFLPGLLQGVSGRAERAVSAFATISLIGHMGLTYLVFIWKQELIGLGAFHEGPIHTFSGKNTGYTGIGSETTGYQTSADLDAGRNAEFTIDDSNSDAEL